MAKQEQPISEFWCRLYPELRRLESGEELREIERRFRKQRVARRRGRIVVLTIGVTAAVTSVVAVAGPTLIGMPMWLAVVLSAVLWAIAGTDAFQVAWYRPYIRFVRQHLQDRGIGVCLKCGYDLSGQTEAKCPECGRAFDPKLLGEKTLGQALKLDKTLGQALKLRFRSDAAEPMRCATDPASAGQQSACPCVTKLGKGERNVGSRAETFRHGSSGCESRPSKRGQQAEASLASRPGNRRGEA